MESCPNCSAKIPDQSKFCPECGKPLSTVLQPTLTYRTAGEQEPPDNEVGSSPLTFSDSSHHGQFLPGTKLAGRYRIVSRLGRGGMGEVYRADDLKLGHPVALKFLPKELADDRLRLESLYNEVRLTRQISHPNVCRVYDISEVDGQHFLSMEYIDGEDLRGLLRRISRIPGDKGVQIARQLCAGLAAAHDKGVLHRDLKPANIMIDGRGHVRITDFGLARTTAELKESNDRSGTPAYMAPEQMLRVETTVQSDLYSLGLILYEMFTGKKAHTAESIAELVKMHEQSSSPAKPSSLISDIDPAVEQVILRCLHPKPKDRPQSALSVAAALPGGDLLAAVLAAGETPSPEVVAAAVESRTMSPKAAIGCFATIVVGLILVTLLSQRTLNDILPPNMSPTKLRMVVAEERILKKLGYDAEMTKQVDNAYGFIPVADRSGTIDFWYRTSPVHLVPNKVIQNWENPLRLTRGLITYDDPPLVEPWMTRMKLDPKTEYLKEFQAVLPKDVDPKDPKTLPDYTKDLGDMAKLDLQNNFAPSTAVVTGADSKIIWKPKEGSSKVEEVELTIEKGWPVSFRVKLKDKGVSPGSSEKLNIYILFLLIMVPTVIMVPRNLRLGRGDRTGAFRVAAFTFSLMMLRWLVSCEHVPKMAEASLLFMALARAILWATMYWLLYLAFEPTVRRLSPRVMISWSRLLSGQFKDPLIARDLVIGIVAGVAISLLHRLHSLADPSETEFLPILGLLGMKSVVHWFLSALFQGLEFGLVILLLVCLLRIVLGNQRRAVVVTAVLALALLLSRPGSFDLAQFAWNLLFRGLEVGLVAVILLRYGFLPVVVVYFLDLLLLFPLTFENAWYAGGGYIAITVVIALTLYGFFILLGDPRPGYKADGA